MDQPTAPPGKISKYKTICSSGNLRRGGGGGGGGTAGRGRRRGMKSPQTGGRDAV